MNTDHNSELSRFLLQNEELIWTGHPKRGFILDRNQWLALGLITTSLLAYFIIVFMIVHEFTTIPWQGVVFVSFVALTNFVISFAVEARRRKHTVYGLTNQRIIILAKRAGRMDSIPLDNLTDIDYHQRNDGAGTISFFKKSFGNMWGLKRVQSRTFFAKQENTVLPAFELIPNVKKVYNKIIALKKK